MKEKQASGFVRNSSWYVFSVVLVVRLENNDLICPDADGLIELWHFLETRALFFQENDAFNDCLLC